VDSWDYPAPCRVTVAVEPQQIDAYGHVNNAVYLSWFDQVAWFHSNTLGVPLEKCIALRRGMAAVHTVVDYHRAAVLGDRLEVATWIVTCDRRLRATRCFQVLRTGDRATLARARIDYVCIDLDSGRPARFPGEFVRHYVPTTAPPAPA
jgi:acyl-CoA thioester hydrolase